MSDEVKKINVEEDDGLIWEGFIGESTDDVASPVLSQKPSQPVQMRTYNASEQVVVLAAKKENLDDKKSNGEKKAQASATVMLDIGLALTTEPRPRDFSLPCLRAGTVGGLVSPGGAGKSMLAAQLALMVATGLDAVPGLRSKPGWENVKTGKVHYASFEDGSEDAAARLYGIWQAIGAKADRSAIEIAKTNLHVETLTGIRAPDLLDYSEWHDWVIRTCIGKRLVVIDTLRMAHLGDENDSGQMARLMAVMQGAAMQSGAAILFLHHISKGAALSGQGSSQQAARGSSVITDNARGQFFLSTMTEDEAIEQGGQLFDLSAPGKLSRTPLNGADDDGREMRTRYVRFGVAKSNYSAPWPDVWLRREDHGVLACADIRLKAGSGSSSSGKPTKSTAGAKLV